MTDVQKISLGLDFGTESVRALLVDLEGRELGNAVINYPHGQITDKLPGTGEVLPPDFAFQHPHDWIESSVEAVRDAISGSGIDVSQIIGIGVDFTSCTMLPALKDGTPLCMTDELAGEKFAWPKLWKHHGAITQTDKINRVATERGEDWLSRYGGIIGLEWFFPKILETLEEAPQVYEKTEVWLEGGDWYVWQLVDADAENLPRSTCQAGYKAMWNSETGFPSPEFFEALHPEMKNVVSEKMPGRMVPPGESAGTLNEKMAEKFGIPAGIPVSACIIDAHSGVPGVGASEAGTFVMVMGTSSCHMLNSLSEESVPGVAGVVKDGILPGYYGYETGQAAVGDAFDWLRKLLSQDDYSEMMEKAENLPPGAEGVLCMDWFNGCRTPLMDGALKGGFIGLNLNHGNHHLYRALMEASAFGVRWIVDILRDNGVPVEKLVATGGLPHHNPLVVKIYADVLGLPVYVHPSKQGPALGAAILGALAAGAEVTGFSSVSEAVEKMAGERENIPERTSKVVEPDPEATQIYEDVYRKYRKLADVIQNFGN